MGVDLSTTRIYITSPYRGEQKHMTKSSYQPLNYDRFIERLKADEYGSIAGARRGIGKSAMSTKEKEKAGEIATKHFGADAAPAKAVTAKAAPATRKGLKKLVRKPGRKAKVVEVVAEAAPSEPKVRKQRAKKQAATGVATPRVPVLADHNKDLLSQVHILGMKVGTYAQAVTALEKAKQNNPKLDVSDGMRAAKEGLTASILEMQALGVAAAVSDKEQEAVVAPELVSGNGSGSADVLSKFREASNNASARAKQALEAAGYVAPTAE